jgi:hypothetical protein
LILGRQKSHESRKYSSRGTLIAIYSLLGLSLWKSSWQTWKLSWSSNQEKITDFASRWLMWTKL